MLIALYGLQEDLNTLNPSIISRDRWGSHIPIFCWGNRLTEKLRDSYKGMQPKTEPRVPQTPSPELSRQLHVHHCNA